ncbi:MAG: inner membrane CreD family protein [Phycisphaerae bacterium]
MSAFRLIAIMVIFGVVSIGWVTLAGSVAIRTERLDQSLSGEMATLWGPKLVAQSAPFWAPDGKHLSREEADVSVPASSDIRASIRHENRDKGLLWYSTFTVDFHGEYGFEASEVPADKPVKGLVRFDVPWRVTPIDLRVSVDGNAVELPYDQKVSGKLRIPLDRTRPHVVTVAYRATGQDYWAYCPGEAVSHLNTRHAESQDSHLPVQSTRAELRNFRLAVTTDFRDIDYPRGSRSPSTEATVTDDGTVSKWEFRSIITHQPMGIVMPRRPNAGPIVARMSLFAPVSLLFFFTAVFTICVLKKIPLHPMHYLFLAAGFFAFHILLAYLADHVNIHAAFWVSATVSVVLVVSYLRLVAGVKFAVFYAGASQLLYLVGFSYAFFWVGMTGLTVTIGAVATLFVLMQATGRVDWFEVFRPRPDRSPDGDPVTPPAAPEGTG